MDQKNDEIKTGISKMKHLVLFLIITVALPATSQAAGCLSQHLKEAVEINTARMPVYAQISKGRSLKISISLIRSERLLLLVAPFVELQERYFAKRDLPIFCDSFVSMEHLPPFKQQPIHDPQPATLFKTVDSKLLKKQIRGAFKTGSFEGVSRVLDQELTVLAEGSQYNCMYRHLLESMLRWANRAPVFIEEAQKRNLKSPAKIYWRLIRNQLRFLNFANKLDIQARPLQAEGIPILCQDVPVIPQN